MLPSRVSPRPASPSSQTPPPLTAPPHPWTQGSQVCSPCPELQAICPPARSPHVQPVPTVVVQDSGVGEGKPAPPGTGGPVRARQLAPGPTRSPAQLHASEKGVRAHTPGRPGDPTGASIQLRATLPWTGVGLWVSEGARTKQGSNFFSKQDGIPGSAPHGCKATDPTGEAAQSPPRGGCPLALRAPHPGWRLPGSQSQAQPSLSLPGGGRLTPGQGSLSPPKDPRTMVVVVVGAVGRDSP